MQLYLSHTSPFGRLCLTRAWLLGRNDLQLHFLDPWQNPPELEAENPFSQIPVLLTDSGEAIYNSHLICQYLDPNMPSAAELSVISYATSLLDNTVQAFKLEKRVGESREHFLVQRSLEAVARALPLAPSFHAAARQWPQMMLGVCLLTLKLRYPELFALRARADTQQAVAVFEQLAFIHHTNPEALSAILRHATANGVIPLDAGSWDSVLRLLPSVVISEALIDDAMTVLEEALATL